ncbi:LysR family transcriptional regulator [Herbaspirillum seropedicae]|uniref:LysR family transcription regulator protein n=1 Tax=Herbaspirillum seropedicae (strain SmR1) TaxID=757424 RepID=D8IPG7_HERSS|nr:LysR substrate-binding domain-containing protein [Herbaspirillum seropedicae]ADJ62987.1 LysR family transcription regulator protein [Herbaspirillum seropedicae SmR1]AKN65071.1 LysR family transcriptional regulator [Herbaspirillum seropedicae]UMU21020.1 LysR family transcriptional regulator [Herbaspirillum seropedicae]
MNLAALDTRLLQLLDAVLDETHLARAAARVGMSLPAAASALERCRQLLREPLRQALAERHAASASAGASAQPQRVRILMPDYPAQVVAQPLYRELADSAGALTLEFQPWQGDAHAAASLESGHTELVLGAITPNASLRVRDVLQERCVAVMRRDHPAAQGLTLAKWLAHPQLRISCHDTLNRMLDEQLATQGHRARIGMVIPNFLMAPALLHGSDLIALMPMHCVPAASAAHPVALSCLRPPLPLDAPPLRLLHHRRHAEHAAVSQVAQALERIVRQHLDGR